MPCNPPPWGALTAVDMKRGEIVWEVPLGTTEGRVPFLKRNYGMPGVGGPMITSGGLVFIGAVTDNYLRAIDIESGRELWKGKLPAGGQATPMTYSYRRAPVRGDRGGRALDARLARRRQHRGVCATALRRRRDR